MFLDEVSIIFIIGFIYSFVCGLGRCCEGLKRVGYKLTTGEFFAFCVMWESSFVSGGRYRKGFLEVACVVGRSVRFGVRIVVLGKGFSIFEFYCF